MESLEHRIVLTSYTVDTTADVVAADGFVSLREAIAASNSNANVFDAPAGSSSSVDEITFSPALRGMQINLVGGPLEISDALKIVNTNSGQVTLSGMGTSRILTMAPGVTQVTISNLVLQNGNAVGQGDARGGAILVGMSANVILSNLTILNSAADDGGALFNAGGLVTITGSTFSSNVAKSASGSGGAIFSQSGDINISTSQFNFNKATRAGGAIEIGSGPVTIALTNFINNDVSGLAGAPSPGNGGAIHVTGAADLNISGGVFLGNLAAREGGALWTQTGGTTTISNGTLFTQNSAGGNAADDGGGAIFNNGGRVILDGTARTINVFNNSASGTLGSGGAIFNLGGSVVVTATKIFANRANRAGGGIEATAGSTTTLTDVILEGNNTGVSPLVAAPGNGGGLHITGNGNVTLTRGEVTNNLAAQEGGGLWNGTGIMTINGTLISRNTASGPLADDGGGGIFNNGGTLNITGATLDSNVADGTSGSGGGIFSIAGNVTLTETAVQFNSAHRAGGGIELVVGNLTMVSSSLINNAVTGPRAAPGNGGGLHVTGAANTTIDGGSVFGNQAANEGGGLWNSATGTLLVRNGTLLSANGAFGNASDSGGGGIYNDGGAVTLDGTTSLIEVSDNFADGTSGSGGGILNVGGTLTVTRTRLSGNEANRAGGGIEATAGSTTTLTDVIFTRNNVGVSPLVAAPGNGGAIHISGNATTTIRGGSFSLNTAAREGGAFWNQVGAVLNVSSSTLFTNNVAHGGGASQGGGAIFNNGGEVNLDGVFLISNAADGVSGSGGAILNLGGALAVQNTLISFNTASRAGGGIEDNGGSTTLVNSSLTNNSAQANPGNGGGLHISGASAVNITSSRINNNSATLEGGGLWNSDSGRLTIDSSTISGNMSATGAGIFQDGIGGVMMVTSSTLSNNQAAGDGGGIALEGGSATINTSTLSGNSAVGNGGAVFQVSGTVRLLSSTIANNSAGISGGGVRVAGGEFNLTNSIIATNSSPGGPDSSGTLVSGGSNLIGNASGTLIVGDSTGNLMGVSAGLGPLQDNGGPTQTHALNLNSAAIDQGKSTGLSVDQRGVPRPLGNQFDMGAFESPFAARSAAAFASTSDINRDGRISPTDALLIISFLNTRQPEGEASRTNNALDVNQDGRVSPVDALIVISLLRQPIPPSPVEVLSPTSSAKLLDQYMAINDSLIGFGSQKKSPFLIDFDDDDLEALLHQIAQATSIRGQV